MNKHGLAYTGTAEEADLTTFEEGLDKVDNLDTGIENLLGGGEVLKFRRFAVDAVAFLALRLGHTVDGLAYDVEQATVDILAHGHRDGTAEHCYFHTALQTVSAVHCYGTHGVLANVLLAFKYDLCAVGTFDRQCVVNVRKCYINVEGNIDHGADNLRDFSFAELFHVDYRLVNFKG